MLGLAAATCSPARAESGAPVVPLPAVPDLAATAAAALEEMTLPEVPLPQADAPELQLEPVAAVASPTTLPAVPAQTTAAEPARIGAVAAPPPEPVSRPAGAPEPDLPTPDAPPGAVEQTAPANVNVSVRVDSPGDAGAVEQTNAAEGATIAQYQPDAPGYQEPIPADGAQAAGSAADSSASGNASTWEWTWSWNCLDAVPQIPSTPNGPVQNWTWNWNWDCTVPDVPGGNSSGQSGGQYQPGVSQYRPVNINISIRINSPGDDGPVTQTNLAAATTVVFPTVRVELPGAPAEVVQGPVVVVDTVAPAPEAQAEPAAQLVELLF
ncbi:MAG: hypothetical protein HOQ03_01670, partial [Thermoleophilia bacterium]|nr:hypothetical protein [Thermoleophilia bacterium]